MTSTALPPIYRGIRRLLMHTVDICGALRYHKYTVCTDLREQVMRLMCRVNRTQFKELLINIVRD